MSFQKENWLYKITVINTVTGQTLFRSYGRCIAEFLKKGSLVHLGLLDLSTCVGLRYGRLYLYVSKLFWSAWVTRVVKPKFHSHLRFTPHHFSQFIQLINIIILKICEKWWEARRLDSHTIRLLWLPCRALTDNNITGTGILTRCPSPTLLASA